MEDERGLRCEAREVSLRVVSTKSRDNDCRRRSYLSRRFNSVRLVHAGRSGNRSLGRVNCTAATQVALCEGDGCACAAKHTKAVEVVMRAAIFIGVTFDRIGNMETCL